MKKIKIKFIDNMLDSKSKIVLWWIFIVIFSKIIRYTILKVTLVDASIGHHMIYSIINHYTKFKLFDNDSGGDASGNAAFIFDKLNIFGLTTYIQFEVFITIIFNILVMIIILKGKNKYTSNQYLFIITSIMMLNIFSFNLAKEPIQFLYFFLMFIVLNSNINLKLKLVSIILCIFLCTLTFRTYYILILYFGIIFFLLYKLIIGENEISFLKIVFILIIIGISYYFCLSVVKSIAPDIYFELIRVRHRQSMATTDIRALFKTNNLISYTLDYVIVLLRLLFPIELIRFGPKFLLYIFSQLVVTIVFINSFINQKNISYNQKIALYIYIGYLLTSACFEPDFGSWVRHESTVFPITVFLSGIINHKEEAK